MTPTTPAPPTIDFAQVRQQYPAAFACLNLWGESLLWRLQATLLHVDQFVFSVPDNLRDLFDFFDQQGVYVIINRLGTAADPFSFEFECGQEMYELGSYHPTRAGAEVAAFLAGFGKLEEMLTKKGGEPG